MALQKDKAITIPEDILANYLTTEEIQTYKNGKYFVYNMGTKKGIGEAYHSRMFREIIFIVRLITRYTKNIFRNKCR